MSSATATAAAAQEAHQKRLAQLLESGRLTPAASPIPAAADEKEEIGGKSRRGKKRSHPKPQLEAVAEGAALPDSIAYIVAVSSRSPEVSLENDHNIHCLCSFPTHQAAYDWIQTHRLALARHYLQDAALTQDELTANSAGFDELYLGEHTSMEILQVPHFLTASGAPPPDATLFADHFASKRSEEEHEAAVATANGDAADDEEGKEEAPAAEEGEEQAAPAAKGKGGKKAAATKAGAKRRKT